MDIEIIDFFPEPIRRVRGKKRIGTIKLLIHDLGIVLSGIVVNLTYGEIVFQGVLGGEYNAFSARFKDVTAFSFLEGEKRDQFTHFLGTTAKEFVKNKLIENLSEEPKA